MTSRCAEVFGIRKKARWVAERFRFGNGVLHSESQVVGKDGCSQFVKPCLGACRMFEAFSHVRRWLSCMSSVDVHNLRRYGVVAGKMGIRK